MSGARLEQELLGAKLTPSEQLRTRYSVEELERMERMENAAAHPKKPPRMTDIVKGESRPDMSRLLVQGYEVEYVEEPTRTIKREYLVDYKANRKAGQSQDDRVLEKTLLREKVVRAV